MARELLIARQDIKGRGKDGKRRGPGALEPVAADGG